MIRLILGCGYLGRRVAKMWLDAGDQVFAVSRSQPDTRSAQLLELEQAGLKIVTADITEAETLQAATAEIPPVHTILFAVGFDRARYANIRDVYVDGLQAVLGAFENRFQQFIYISTTGVYGLDCGSEVTEQTPVNPVRPGGIACVEAERLLESQAVRATVLRLAGIYGPERVPNLSAIKDRQWDKLNPNGHVNLIHVNDAAEIVLRVSNDPKPHETFLVSDGEPALRKDFYNFIAEQLGETIDWSQSNKASSTRSADKRISNGKLLKAFPDVLRYPNYRAGIVELLADSSGGCR